MKRVIIFFFIFFGIQETYAQFFELGGEVGYGKTTYDYHLSLLDLFDKDSYNNLNFGITGSFNPIHSPLFLNASLLYQRKEDDNSSLNYFEIPIGLDIAPGRKFRFIIGGGFYVGYLFTTTGSPNQDLEDSHSDIQIGGYTDIGFKYQFKKQWNIFVKMNLNLDLSPLYKRTIPQHFGNYSYENIKSYDYSVNLGFSYMIPVNKEKNK